MTAFLTLNHIGALRRVLPRRTHSGAFSQVAFAGKQVASPIAAQRIAICRECDKRRIKPPSIEWCGILGCQINGRNPRIEEFAGYEENLPQWGCKHPLRREGRGWPNENNDSRLKIQSREAIGSKDAPFCRGAWEGADIRSEAVSTSTPATKPRVACIITCHNYGKFLGRCIESCLGQTTRFDDVIVIDDASNDNTQEVAESYAHLNVRYIRGEWNNVCAARNAGAKTLGRRVDFLLFMDADDWMEADYVTHLLTAANKAPQKCGVIYGTLRCITEGSNRSHTLKLVRPFSVYGIQKQNLAGTPSLIRRCAFDQVGGWCESIAERTDWNLWLRLVQRGWMMQYVPQAVLNYRKHSASTTGRNGDSREAGALSLCHGMLISIVTPFCGRDWALPVYERSIGGLLWERENLFIVAIDNSGSEVFAKALNEMLCRTGCAHTVIRHKRAACNVLTSRQLADSAGARSRNFSAMNEQMCALYSCANEMIPNATGMVWTLEDDIEVPPNALLSLTGLLYSIHDVGVAVGCAKSRFRQRWMLWKDGHAIGCPPPGSEVRIDRSGFYCSLFRREAWDSVAFMPDDSTKALPKSYDWSAYDHLRTMGFGIVAHGDVVCKHWQADGTQI